MKNRSDRSRRHLVSYNLVSTSALVCDVLIELFLSAKDTLRMEMIIMMNHLNLLKCVMCSNVTLLQLQLCTFDLCKAESAETNSCVSSKCSLFVQRIVL